MRVEGLLVVCCLLLVTITVTTTMVIIVVVCRDSNNYDQVMVSRQVPGKFVLTHSVDTPAPTT